MKRLILLMAGVLIGFASYSQTVTDVVTVDSTLNKQTLYSNALSFFAVEFKSANNVIQMKDSDAGKVIGKGIAGSRDITITITCKDGRYKYEIDITPIPNLIFEITKFGMYNGKTIGTIDGDVMFVWGNGHNWPNVHLNGEGTPMGMKKAYAEWKSSVDAEIEKNKVSKISDILLNNLISDLKTAMAKKSDF